MWVENGAAEAYSSSATKCSETIDDASLFVQFLLEHLTEHAFAIVVIVSQSLLKALAHLQRNHWSRNHLGVRVFQAGAGVDSVILEDRNERDARVEAEFIVASFVDAEDFRHVGIGHQGHHLRVVGRLHDHIVDAEAVYRPARTVYSARRLHIAGDSRKLIRHHSRLPRNIQRGGYPHYFRGSQLFVSRAKRTARDKRCRRFPLAVARHFFRTAGALGCDYHPFLSSKILAQF